MYQENADLAAENTLIAGLEKENAELRRLLDMNPINYANPCHAEIIIRDPVSWNEIFTVDRGTYDGVSVGDLVLGMLPPDQSGTFASAVAGRVIAVSENTATVATVLSSECILSVILTESASHGIIQGEDTPGDKTVPLKYLSPDAKYGLGEIVTTSGYSDLTPAGIYIGTLAGTKDGNAAQLDDSRLYAESRLHPALDLENIRFVTILTKKKGF